MKEEKKTFKEKWQDKKYQAKVKLSGYGIFILIVIIMLAFGQEDPIASENDYNNLDNIDNIETNIIKFDKPNLHYYTYEIEVVSERDNVKEIIKYNGKVDNNEEELIKIIDNIEYKYKIKDNKYYVLEDDSYILTSIDKVYDNIEYKYLDIDNINTYLSVSNKVNNEYHVYLRDIILDSETNKYITILMEDNEIEIDYTNLINYLNNIEYDSYVVNINYDV